jgi:hypothetical protein
MKCPHCQADKMTVAEFTAAFKPGDMISGWSTGKVVQVTAIGESRFLYLDGNRLGAHGKEFVTSIRASWFWKKVTSDASKA